MVTRKLNKYINDKNVKKYKKLEINVSKNTKRYQNNLFNKQSNNFSR